ncbi:MAG: BamA/TamA family outer membrane protein [Acidobacteriota bacterium]
MLTSSQTPVLPSGNYAIIPPGKFEKTESKKNDPAKPTTDSEATTPDNSSPAPSSSQISGLNDRAQSEDRNAPRRENVQAFKVAGNYVKALIGGFDQGAGFGFGVELSTAELIPIVEFRAKAFTSTRLYRRFEVGAFVKKLGDEKTHLDLWFNYQKRTRDNFYGLGPRASDLLETNFASDQRSYNASIYRDFTKKIQVGLYTQLANTDSYRGEDDKEPAVDVLFSGRPTTTPITRWVPGLNVNAKLFSYGAFGEFNGRDVSRGLPKGAYGYARIASFEGLDNDSFSDFGWNEIELDGRAYIPLGSDFTSLALRAYTQLQDPKGGSQIPFYEQSFLGGRNFVRGFQNYRFRGNNVLVLTVEPRQTVWKRSETKGLDVFAFGDGGQIWGDNRSKTNALILANDKFSSQNWRFAIGGGLQYRLNKSTGFRLEVGHSNESNQIFFSVGRGF